MKKYLAVCILICFSNAGLSQKKKKKDDNKGLIVLPVIFSSPETSLGFGAAGMYYFRTDTSSITRPSNFQLVFIYTLENQVLLEAPFDIFLRENKFWIRGSARYYIYPFQYYGEGNSIDIDLFDNYDATYNKVDLDLFKRFKENLFIGPQYKLTQIYSISSKQENNLLTNDVIGYRTGTISGLGAGMILDHRNNVFSPDQGYFISFSAFRYGRLVGSDYSFTDIIADFRKYVPVGEKRELAFQFYHNSVMGDDVPFYNLARLGGSSIMRGYYEGAYRDNHYTSFQSEFRMYLFRNIVGSSFASVGAVSDDFGQYNKLLPSAGIGLRYELDKKEKIRIRADFAVGKNTTGFYLNINEAF